MQRSEEPSNSIVVSSASKSVNTMDLVELAKQIEKANAFTRANAGSKLAVIAEQARFLQEQARKVLEEAKRDNDLHQIACNFKKQPGQMYHMYRCANGRRYFSMLSPQEWGTGCPHEFLGSYKLEYDMSWTEEADVERKEDEMKTINKILDANNGSSSKLRIKLESN